MASYVDYEKAVHQALWSWADQYHADELDDGKRQGRPPVLVRESASKNILVPSDRSKANDIRAAVPRNRRHRWFRSLKSSQALVQSVFGAVRAFDRLDLLQDVSAECGRPAFFEGHRGTTLDFEHEVRCLEEPRRTSIDVLVRGLQKRVAIECKFTERDFGTCSRPRLRPGDATYSKEHCDGSYRVQHGRRARCALTEIGVQYWDYLPDLFDWPADRDHESCPFGSVYQLARNALAAALTPDGELDPAGGHALVVYDARNLAFQPGGKARKQWEAAFAACLVPGFMRRLSWQRLMAVLARAPELAYLVDGVGRKCGFRPD